MSYIKFIYGDHLFKNLAEAKEFFDSYEDHELPEALPRAKAMQNSKDIRVDGLVDDMLLSLDEGSHGGDVVCPDDDCFSSTVTSDELALLKGFLTLWFDALKFKMYTEDMDAEPYPFKANEITERQERKEREEKQQIAEAAKLTRDYLLEKASQP